MNPIVKAIIGFIVAQIISNQCYQMQLIEIDLSNQLYQTKDAEIDQVMSIIGSLIYSLEAKFLAINQKLIY